MKKNKKKIMIIFGTRPEAIKMGPVVKAFNKNNRFETVVVVTGQHEEMLNQVLEVFEIVPDYNLHIMKRNQTLFDITSNILVNMKEILEKETPDMVLVHGDTTTTFASAIAAFYLKIPVSHVEAGLRTNNFYSPFPEEFNRQAVSIVATLNFAPTEQARNNLIKEGKNKETVYVTGNTAIDALKSTVISGYESNVINWAKGSRLIVLTAHRRENLGAPLREMFTAIKKILLEYDDIKIVYPIHMNPNIRSLALEIFSNIDNIRLVEPMDVISFHNLLASSYLILTDSGGIQEEAPSLGKPVLVMRDKTERPEGIAAGTLKLVGTSQESIYNSFKELLDNKTSYEKMSKAVNPYGDGMASERIVTIIEKYFNNMES